MSKTERSNSLQEVDARMSKVEPMLPNTRDGQYVNLMIQAHPTGLVIQMANKSNHHVEIEIKLGNVKCVQERTMLLINDVINCNVDNQLLLKHNLWTKPEYRCKVWVFGKEKENFRILRKVLPSGDSRWEIEGVKVVASKYGIVKLSKTLPKCFGCLLFEVQLLRKKGLINVINNCSEELTICVKGERLRLEAVLAIEENVPFYFDLPKQRLIYEFKVNVAGIVSQFVLCGDIMADSTLDYKLMDKDLFVSHPSDTRSLPKSAGDAKSESASTFVGFY